MNLEQVTKAIRDFGHNRFAIVFIIGLTPAVALVGLIVNFVFVRNPGSFEKMFMLIHDIFALSVTFMLTGMISYGVQFIGG